MPPPTVAGAASPAEMRTVGIDKEAAPGDAGMALQIEACPELGEFVKTTNPLLFRNAVAACDRFEITLVAGCGLHAPVASHWYQGEAAIFSANEKPAPES